jgi:hypothetical protein
MKMPGHFVLTSIAALSLWGGGVHADEGTPAESTSGTTSTTTTTTSAVTQPYAAPAEQSPPSFPTIGVSAGTRALNLELGYSVSPYFGVRLVGTNMDVAYKTMRHDIDYKGHYDFQSLGLLGDWYPGGGVFRLTAGVIHDQDRIRAQAQPDSNGVVVVNGVPVPPGDQVYADGRWPHKFVPYAGIGFGNPAAHHQGVGFTADIGAMYTQNPTVTLTAVGPGANNPLTQASVQQEQNNLNADLRKIHVFPVASLGVYYGF